MQAFVIVGLMNGKQTACLARFHRAQILTKIMYWTIWEPTISYTVTAANSASLRKYSDIPSPWEEDDQKPHFATTHSKTGKSKGSTPSDALYIK